MSRKRYFYVDIARKHPGFFRSIRWFWKPSYVGASVLVILWGQLLNLLVIGTMQAPVLAKVPENAPIVQSLPDPSQLAQQGKSLYQEEKFADAAKVWQQAAQVYQSLGDKFNQAKVLSLMSLAFQQLGQWQQGSFAIAQSLEILQNNQLQTKESKLILAQVLNTQGHLQLALGQAEQALTTWEQATATYKQVGNNAGITGSLINQVQALQYLGLYHRANETLTQLEKNLQTQPDSLLKATALRSLGNVLRVVGDLDKSQRILQQTLTLAQKLKSPEEIAASYVSLGTTAQAQHDFPSALQFYQQAQATSTSLITRIQAQLNQLDLSVETKSGSDAQVLWTQIQPEIINLPASRAAVYAQINFAQNLMQLRQSDISNAPSRTQIGQVLATAVQQARNIKDTRALAYALGYLGGLYEQTQQYSDAQDLTQQALNLAETIEASDIAYRWQWQLGRLYKAQGNVTKALANYSQAVNILQSLSSDLVAMHPDVQFSFKESVEPVYREFLELSLQQTGNQQITQENLKQARQTMESLQLAELENFFGSACLDAKVEIDRVVDRDKSAATIYAIILADRLEIIIKLPGQQELRHYTTIVDRDTVEKTILDLGEYLRDITRTFQVKKQSQKLYDWLIRPAEAELVKSDIKTLVFVLDGSLRNIPMAVLYDKEQQKYLVEKYAIALTPGLQLTNPKPLQQVKLNVLSGGVSEKRQIGNLEFPPLKNVARELEAIQSEVSKTKQLFNQTFTETNLQNQIKKVPFSVVHLATHGKFSSNPEETFILAWDRLVKVKDFVNLFRQSGSSQSNAIELLVLSACQTATGDKRAALGLAGVAVRAGARSIVATLWSVDDEFSSKFMSYFYRELKTGVTKAQALQHAQIAVLNNEKRPYFWAPYVLVGNWL
ncbi:MAG: CHAT domain-containing protein [Nostoc sp. ChiSLP02]|nr:CHAT domain-containing protein [Nostoc sp. DedSLP05]MDZ8100998.1 CHAT domain-containing protein [Nostoc sp. DedSLP01]MDZ8188452.1 CHAT domain-containing protein [Nostoc sp. ChiSLP02]